MGKKWSYPGENGIIQEKPPYVTIYHVKIQHLQVLCRASPVIPHFWNVCNFDYQFMLDFICTINLYISHPHARAKLTYDVFVPKFIWVCRCDLKRLCRYEYWEKFFKIRYIENEFFGSKKISWKIMNFQEFQKVPPPTPLTSWYHLFTVPNW